MSQGGDDDGADFGYLEFEAHGTQDSQYEYSDFNHSQQHTQQQHHINNNSTQDDLNFMNLSLNGPQSQSDLGHNDNYHHHHNHGHPSNNGDQRGFEETDEHDPNDQPLALTELPPHACK
jgi:hypothetical protein